MKPQKPVKINEVLERARQLARGIDPSQVKEAQVASEPQITPTPEGNAMRSLAASLRKFDLNGEKQAALVRVLNGDMPEPSALQSKEASLPFSVEEGASKAETLRNLAGALRTIGSEIKTAAHVEAFKQVRGLVAAEKLKHSIGV